MNNNCQNGLCYKTSDNKNFGCPAKMSDGRHFTDYRPDCYVNNLIRQNNSTYNSFQYRMFLTHNAENLMDLNRTYACEKNCCGPCQAPYDVGTMMPSESAMDCNAGKCGPKVSSTSGIVGQKIDSNQTISCPGITNPTQPKNCCAPPKNNFDYYPDNRDENNVKIQRLASPSGGIPLNGGDPNYYN